MKIDVMKMEPKNIPYRDVVENTVDMIRNYVGGYIEAIRIRDDIVMWINEEGKIEDLPYNFALGHNGKIYDYIVGNAIFTGLDEEGNTVTLTNEMARYILSIFKVTEDERLVLEL